jgi:hypothetical protein
VGCSTAVDAVEEIGDCEPGSPSIVTCGEGTNVGR